MQFIRLVSMLALTTAVVPGFADPPAVHSRADLLQGTSLRRFFDFETIASRWEGDGSVRAGALRVEAEGGGDWAVAWSPWKGGVTWAAEWEVRRGGGAFEAEHGFLISGDEGRDRVRIRFSPEGRVAVERLVGGERVILFPWTGFGGLHGSGWNRLALRLHRGMLSVIVAGEEVLTVALPGLEVRSIGLTTAPGGAIDFDHLALHGAIGPGPAGRVESGMEPRFFDSFSVGRDEWEKNIFPVRDGTMQVSAIEGTADFDLLARTVPEESRVVVVLGPGLKGPAALLFHGRSEGADFTGYVWVIDPEMGSFLLERKDQWERRLDARAAPLPLSPEGRNRLEFRSGDGRIEALMNGETLFRWEGEILPAGRFGLRTEGSDVFSIDEVVILSPGETPAGGDVGAERAELWREIESLRVQRANATRTDRLRDLFLAEPELPGLLDLLFRDGVRAGDPETALAAAEAMNAAAGGGAEEEKLRIMGLLLCRRWEEAYEALQRFRAGHPSDPFGLENTLLLLDRTGKQERLRREYEAARKSGEPLRAAGHGAAASAYLRSELYDRAVEALRIGSRIGPGRLDLALLEGDLLHARGDLAGAAARYVEIRTRGVLPVADENLRSRIALVHFEMGNYREAVRWLGELPVVDDGEVRRARAVLRAVGLYQIGAAGREGRPELERAAAIAEAELSDPPVREDAIILDLIGRIRAAMALADFQEGESYPVYREKLRWAAFFFRRAADLDRSFGPPPSAEGNVPDFDHTRFRSLLAAALPDDHPAGGFIEEPGHWSAWSLADRRADLAEAALRLLFDGAVR